MKQTPRELLDAAARTRVPDHLNLYPRMAAQLKRKTFLQTVRVRPALAILLVLLLLAVLSGVVYAVGRLAGFIPGFGFTGDTGTLYVLTEPAQVERGGITLHVENAVSADDKFWILLSLNGRVETDQSLYPGVTILLSDGTIIPFQAGKEDDQNADSRRESYEFPALPLGTDSLTLHYEFLTTEGTV